MELRRTQIRSGRKQSEEGAPQLSEYTDTAAGHRNSRRRGRTHTATDKRDTSSGGRNSTRGAMQSQSRVNYKVGRKGEFRDMDAMYSSEKEVTSNRRGNSKKSKRSTGYKNRSEDSTHKGGSRAYVDNAPKDMAIRGTPVRYKGPSLRAKHNSIDVHTQLNPREELAANTPVKLFYEVETVNVTPNRRNHSRLMRDKTDRTSTHSPSEIHENKPCRDIFVGGLSHSDQTLSRTSGPSPRDAKDTGECIACWDETHVWKALCCGAEMCFSCLDTYVTTKVDSGIVDIKCPGPGCDKRLNSTSMKTLVHPRKIRRLEYLRVKRGWYPHIRTCPFCDNMHYLSEIDSKGLSEITCQGCGKAWCWRCESPWHGKMKCLDYAEKETGIRKWAGSKHKKTRNAQQCPECRVRTTISISIFVISGDSS